MNNLTKEATLVIITKSYQEECREPVYKCYLETIVEERIDGSWDVFLDEPIDDYENTSRRSIAFSY